MRTLREDGVARFYKGYFPYYLRCALNTLFYFTLFDAFKRSAVQYRRERSALSPTA